MSIFDDKSTNEPSLAGFDLSRYLNTRLVVSKPPLKNQLKGENGYFTLAGAARSTGSLFPRGLCSATN